MSKIKLITKEFFYKNVNKEDGFWKCNLSEPLSGYEESIVHSTGAVYFECEGVYFAYLHEFKVLIFPNKLSNMPKSDDIILSIMNGTVDFSDWELVKVADEDFPIKSGMDRIDSDFGEYVGNIIHARDKVGGENWEEFSKKYSENRPNGTYGLRNKTTLENIKFFYKLDCDYYYIIENFAFPELFNYPVDVKETSRKEKFIKNLFNILISKNG